MYKINIRPLKKEDAKISYVWRNNPQVWENTGKRPDIVITEEIETNWIEKILLEENSERFAIMIDTNYIGNVQLTNIKDKSAIFHIFIGDPEYWGQGIGTVATCLMIERGFDQLELEKIKLRVRKGHSRAYNIYKKLGFKTTHEDDELIHMELIPEDFNANKV